MQNFFLNFGHFSTILHRFTKILTIKVKMSFCHAVAWLFHFKMSPNTAMYAQRLRNGSIFSPVQSSFEISLRKASSADCGGVHKTQLTPVKSRVVQNQCVLSDLFSLHITCQKRRRNIIS